jgi:hypothetical protein
VRTIFDPEYQGQKQDDIITILFDKEKREVVMSDSWMERDTNKDFAVNATGDVLIAGLGLGLIILAIQGKPEVRSITIIEKDKELGEFVLKQLSQRLLSKVKIVYADIFKYKTDRKFNTIYFDIWNKLGNPKDYAQMTTLKKRFKRNRVKPIKQSPISCWREADMRRLSEPKRSGGTVNMWW